MIPTRPVARVGGGILGACCALAFGVSIANASPPPAYLTARAVTLVEETTGQPLYGYNQNQELPIASTTKLMTALLTIEHAHLSQVFTEPNYYPSAVDSQIGLRPGERMSVHDLLLALLLPSADDAAEDLAYNVGHRSVARFVGMMNARAQQLGLTRTHYSTPIGLDTPGNYSTASDLVKLAGFLLQNHPFFAHAVALRGALLRSGDHQRYIANRNTLVRAVPWVNGVKTGHTRGAGYVLVGSGTRGGMTLISAVLGTPSESARDSDSLAVLRYGFENFKLSKPVAAGQVIARLPVRDQSNLHIPIIAARSFARVVGLGARVSTRAKLPRELNGPLRRHAVVGSLQILQDGRVIARTPLLTSRSVPAVSPLTQAARFATRPLPLVAVVILLAMTIVLVGRQRATSRRGGRR